MVDKTAATRRRASSGASVVPQGLGEETIGAPPTSMDDALGEFAEPKRSVQVGRGT